MGYEHPLALLTQFLFTLLYVGCAVTAIVKWRGSAATALLCAGFGALFLTELLFIIVRWGYVRPSYELFQILPFFRAFGYILILVGLILAPGRASPSAAPDSAATGSPLPPSRHRPGWGLVSAWIVVSSLGVISGLVSLVVVLDAGSSISNREMEGILIACGVSFLFVVPSTILYLIWLYQAWDSVPAPFRSVSPGQAVGFLFIPAFNLYWVFRAVPGLSASIGRAMQAHDPRNTGAPGFGMGVTACVIAVIPYVNILAWPFFLTWICQTNAARNRMILASAGPEKAAA